MDGLTCKVVSVSSKAFYKNKKMKTLTIGSNITTIGSKAACGCRNLKTVTIKFKKITKIGKKAFKGCRKQMTFKVPKSKFKVYKKMLKKSGAARGAEFKMF